MADLVIPYSVTFESAYLSALRERLVRAEVWLRMVASGEIPLDAGAGAAEGTPTYTVPVERVERPARMVDEGMV